MKDITQSQNNFLTKFTFKSSNIVRFSSHEELINDIHYLNLLNIARKNPSYHFSLWTKRVDIIRRNHGVQDVKNLTLIFSSPKINTKIPHVPIYFHKVFSVYTKEFARKEEININRSAKRCLDCMKCYAHNKIVFVNEKIKGIPIDWNKGFKLLYMHSLKERLPRPMTF